jgi:hypothetical protein
MSDYEVTLVNDNMFVVRNNYGLTDQARVLCAILWPKRE